MPSPGAKQWLQLIEESAYGVTKVSTPVTISMRLHSDNAFTMVPKPLRKEYMTADTRNRPALNISSQYELQGSLNVLGYADVTDTNTVTFASQMFDWATTIGASGFTDDTKSYTVRHFDGVRNREYLGVKVKTLKWSSAAETDQGVATFALELVAQKMNATDPASFTEPVITVFPKYPYKHIETSGGVILRATGSTTRAKYKSLELTVSNILKPLFYESPYISDCSYNGRTIDMVLGGVQFSAKTDRDNFEAQSAITASAVYTKTAGVTKALTLDLKANTYTTGLDRTMPLGDATHETIHLRSFYDTTATTDFSFAVA